MLAAAFLAGAAAWHFGIVLASNVAYAQDEADSGRTSGLLALFGNVFEVARNEYVDPVSDKQLIENAINGMLTGLDPHSAYLDADEFYQMQVEDKGEFSGIGIELAQENGRVVVVRPMDGTPASRAGIKAGDIIVALNGRPVRGVAAQHIIDRMRGPPNTRVTLTIRRTGVPRPLEVSMQRAVIHLKVVKQRLEAGDIGYVQIAEFVDPVDAALRQAVTSLRRQAGGRLRALVLDLRDNPGGLFDQALAVARDFIPAGEIVSTRARHSEDSEWLGAKGTDILGGAPMVVLINSGSASASEVVAGALQDHRRAVLLGARSFGKGSVQATIPLPGKAGMLLTIARYYTPSGRSIQGRGIVPDIAVAQSRQDAPQFDAEHESELNHTLQNAGGAPDDGEPRTDLPPVARTIPEGPPADFPAFDSARPETDFQLRQALAVAKAMVAARQAGGN
jgi:carboxyl-terminal processing protease